MGQTLCPGAPGALVGGAPVNGSNRTSKDNTAFGAFGQESNAQDFKSVLWIKMATQWLFSQPKQVKKENYALLILWLHNKANWAKGQYRIGLKLEPGQMWATYRYISQKLGLDWSPKKVEKMIKRMEKAGLLRIKNIGHSNKTIISLIYHTDKSNKSTHGETSCQEMGRPNPEKRGDLNIDKSSKSATVGGDQNTSEGETFTQDGGI